MNKLLVASIAGVFASVIAAQTAASSASPKERQSAVQSAAQATAENSGNTQATAAEQAKNVKASTEVTKLSLTSSNDERMS